MNPQKKLPVLKPEENLKFENDILKAKLTAEFGMKESDSSRLDAEMENQWLNYIYDFENTCKNAGRITIYEFIGKPEFRSLGNEKLSVSETEAELDRILDVMAENGIMLDVLCDYENEEELIYKFITEEFFPYEIDNIRIEGMNHCFTYEEFHANHKYDLTNDSEFLLDNIFGKEWYVQFSAACLACDIEYDSKNYSSEAFGKLVMDFQKSGKSYKLKSKEVKEVEFDLEKGIANLKGIISYTIDLKNLSGEFEFDFIFNDYGYWNICKIVLPEDILVK
jgi:hypothetical protein